MVNILVTGVGSLIGQEIIKSIKASSLKCKMIGTDYFKHAVGLYWVDQRYLLPDILSPKITEEIWLSEIINIILREKIDIVLIGLDFEVDIFSRHREKIEKETQCKVIVGEPKPVGICKDKWKTAEFLRANNFPYPKSCLPENKNEFLKQQNFPLVVKPRFGFRSRNFFIVNNLQELDLALNQCPKPVIQELIGVEEQEYTCGSLWMDGKVLSAISLKRDLRDGNTYRAFSADYPEIDQFIKQVSQHLQCDGPTNYQLRLTDKGPIIFEINPRFSGTTYMRVLFGLNEVELLINYILTGKTKDFVQKKHGVVLRYFENQYISWEEYENQ